MNTAKYDAVIEKNLRPQKTKLKFSNFLAGLKVVLSIALIVLVIWLFISLLVYPNSQPSFENYASVSSFYTAKFSMDYTSFQMSLSVNGILLIVMIVLTLGLAMFYALNIRKFTRKKVKSKYYILELAGWIFLAIIGLVLFILLLIPPKLSELGVYYEKQALILSANPSLGLDQLKAIALKLGIPADKIGSTISEVVNTIKTVNLSSVINNYTLFTNSNSGVISYNSAIIAIYILFGIGLGFWLITWLIKQVSDNKVKSSHFTKANLNMMMKNYKVNKAQKAKLKKDRKRLIEEENKLLQNLYDVQITGTQNQPSEQLDQAELERRINENTELKKQLENLAKQKQNLKDQQIKSSKFKAWINKLQQNNSTNHKNKKQEIAVPDKELEEIFKSLDFD